MQRSQNAYVPPGARRALAIQTPPAAVAKADNQLGGAKANGVSAQAAQPPATAVDAKVAPPTARLVSLRDHCSNILCADFRYSRVSVTGCFRCSACSRNFRSSEQGRFGWRL